MIYYYLLLLYNNNSPYQEKNVLLEHLNYVSRHEIISLITNKRFR